MRRLPSRPQPNIGSKPEDDTWTVSCVVLRRCSPSRHRKKHAGREWPHVRRVERGGSLTSFSSSPLSSLPTYSPPFTHWIPIRNGSQPGCIVWHHIAGGRALPRYDPVHPSPSFESWIRPRRVADVKRNRRVSKHAAVHLNDCRADHTRSSQSACVGFREDGCSLKGVL